MMNSIVRERKFMKPLLEGLNVLHENLGSKVWAPPVIDDVGKIIIDNRLGQGMIIITIEPHDGNIWIHASMSRKGHLPSYADLKLLHKAVFEDRWAYQVFAPIEHHINIHPYVLHLYGRADGKPGLPNFVLTDPITGTKGI